MTRSPVRRVLFVCLGNICRSPSAEGVLRALAPDLEIDSAGTGNWHVGKPPYGPAIRAAKTRGYDLSSLRARQFSHHDFTAFDEILVMDHSNLADVEAQRPSGATTPVRLFLDYAPDQPVREVPDPYYTRDFDEALDLIEVASRGFIATHDL
ncbi:MULTISPECIES: low molecular weight protein-tyrosine-phosphatase [unclassified Meridianimarinicoccus]|uniref:low molecular weight protein-tyrosine-phosphatase n=1 Tax=unclassified Meridianimarinicoccus TaxID=2923344 RepID=UPI0018696645|nr:low molecular weight protein-tyrosine-phosphatase [Fluviibacterium sp. MJW13]